MTFNKEQDYWVSAFSTNEFLSIETYFGLGRFAIDPLFPPHFLQPNENEKIGEIVLQALSNSRSLTSIEERIDFLIMRKVRGNIPPG